MGDEGEVQTGPRRVQEAGEERVGRVSPLPYCTPLGPPHHSISAPSSPHPLPSPALPALQDPSPPPTLTLQLRQVLLGHGLGVVLLAATALAGFFALFVCAFLPRVAAAATAAPAAAAAAQVAVPRAPGTIEVILGLDSLEDDLPSDGRLESLLLGRRDHRLG